MVLEHKLDQMKKLKPFLILLIFSCFSCDAQIYQELEGSWLPEKYVLAVSAKDTLNAAKHLFPVEVFQIFRQEAQKFSRDYASDLNNRDTINIDDFILIRTYKSEFNGFNIEKVTHDGKVKYKLPRLYAGMNMKYISSETVDRYEEADIYISRNKNKLVLEIIENGKIETIFFVNGVDNYTFKSFDDAKRYLKVRVPKKE